ncbi:hypothetical protein F5X98DRAFT_382584 [Xylaria grammica]|nr:hypothetical protein F5X98DRAFT_382584 [Xylaria grammica]
MRDSCAPTKTQIGIPITVPSATVTTVTFLASTGAITIQCPATPPVADIDEPEPDDDGVHVPCTAWFFFLCISWGNTHVRSWYWILPPGIYGPGPPPIGIIRPPPGVTIRGNLPNWPRITIGPDHRLTTESEPECETQTAEACTTTDYVSDGTATSSTTLCETITG